MRKKNVFRYKYLYAFDLIMKPALRFKQIDRNLLKIGRLGEEKESAAFQ